MTPSSLSLFSILIGVLACMGFAHLYPKFSMGSLGNSMSGVFGSVLFIKTFGRLGFGPLEIVSNNTFHVDLFVINSLTSILGAIICLIVFHRIKQTVN